MNHYPRHVGDITRDTFGLSPTEFGCYDRMLDHYYASEAPLPLDVGEVYRITGARTPADRKATEYVLGKFFSKEADGWHQARCDRELLRYRERADSARNNGARGGRPRTKPTPDTNRPITESVISGLANRTDAKAKQEPEPIPSDGGLSEPPTTAPATLPGTLNPATWREWRAHLANRGKGMTPQQERLQLARLAGHRDPETVVQTAICNGHLRLEPVGGWPDAKPQTATDKRAATAAAMYAHRSSNTHHDDNQPRDITGTAERLA